MYKSFKIQYKCYCECSKYSKSTRYEGRYLLLLCVNYYSAIAITTNLDTVINEYHKPSWVSRDLLPASSSVEKGTEGSQSTSAAQQPSTPKYVGYIGYV